MTIYDISFPIRKDSAVWPGQPAIEIKPLSTVAQKGAAVSWLSFSSHIGTHVDAPAHFLDGGKGIDEVSLETLIGPARVLDLSSVNGEISPHDLELHHIKNGDRILFKTKNSTYLLDSQFHHDYVSLSLEGAHYLVEKKIAVVGTDYLGIEKRGSPNHPVHKALLSAGIVIVEGLYLANIPAGSYEFTCLPLKIVGGDGAPARAILIKSSV